MEGIVNMGDVHASGVDGIASNKGGGGFEFGSNDKAKGILNKPIGPMFKVQWVGELFIKKLKREKGKDGPFS